MVIKQRKFTISIFVILVLSAIVIFDISYITSQEAARLDTDRTVDTPSIPTEEGVFRRSEYALDYLQMPQDDNHARDLEAYYANRAYPGAPPKIPHALISEKGIGGTTCLQCHENGGFVPQFEAYAPVTPHPEMINCRQCHVPSKTNRIFKGTDWVKVPHPAIKNAALVGSPPVIPHSLQMRENCLSCHAGPAAPREIKVSHPLRINCRQCHAQGDGMLKIEWDSTQWVRGANAPLSKQ